MEHFITKIYIDKVRHLNNISIELSQDRRRHLILTGKNGSGKTSLLNAMKAYLLAINEGNCVFDSTTNLTKSNFYQNMNSAGIGLSFSTTVDLEAQYLAGNFITAFFPADRLTRISIPNGVEDVKLNTVYSVDQQPVRDLVKYLVHLKTQQAYAQNEGDIKAEKSIEGWFSQFEKALRKLMDDDSISLKYDYKKYNFLIKQKGREPFGFHELSDGFSAAIYILADILMRMDKGWLLKDTVLDKTIEGVVLIDEIETHLHLELQRSILPFLTEMFPNLQFIVTTHSPFVVNSLESAVIYDLENKTLVKGGLSNVTYEGIVEGYFRADTLSEVLRNKFERYKTLITQSMLSDDDYDEIMSLEQYLDEIPDYLSIGIAEEYSKLKLEFRNREDA